MLNHFTRTVLLAAVVSSAASHITAQMLPAGPENLPPADILFQSPAPAEPINGSLAPPDLLRAEPPAQSSPDGDSPGDGRSGMFQKALFDATYLPRSGIDGLGMADFELKSVLAVPCPTRNWPLLIIPGFAVHLLDAPASTGLPPRVYDAYAMFRWLPKLGPNLMFDLAVTPGVYRDFEQNTADGFRVTMHAAGIWTLNPQWKLVAGLMYLDRRDVNIAPVGGLMWHPTPDWNFDLVFPEPKISRRVYWFSPDKGQVEDAFYLAGEFADDLWAVARPEGIQDRIGYFDSRALLGFEHKVSGGISGKVEVGYVFSRKVISYDTSIPPIVPPATLLMRAGLTY